MSARCVCAAASGLGPDADAHYAEVIASVTAEDVRAVAQRVIDFSRSALAVVGP